MAQVQAETNGSVKVRAQLQTEDGTPIGHDKVVEITATQAGTIGWLIAIGAGVVLVGTTAAGLLDIRVTPVGEAYVGVETHANLISGLMDGRIAVKPDYALGYDLAILALAGLTLAFALPLLSAPGVPAPVPRPPAPVPEVALPRLELDPPPAPASGLVPAAPVRLPVPAVPLIITDDPR